MNPPPLQTYDTRRMRSLSQRRRRHAITTAVTAGVLIAGAAGVSVWAIARPTHAIRPVAAAPAAPVAAQATPTATTPAPAAPTTATPDRTRPATITISAVGDMIFDRQVRALISKSGGSAPLARVADHLSRADITVGNLESSLSDEGTRNADKDVTLHGDPRGIEGLKIAGFDFVSMANNHVLDFGPLPMLDTIATLDSAGIGHAGAGANKAAAWEPATATRRGAKVAYLAFGHIVPAGFIARDDRPGMASGKWDMSLVRDAIREAKRHNNYVLVSFHWGVEYTDNPLAEQVTNAHLAIDAGADMVLAHHPHVIQSVEYYKGRLIAYSLGDFVFDHYSRKTGEAFILDAELGPDGVANARAVPVYLDGYGRPEIVTGSEATAILTRLKNISGPRRTTVAISDNTARILP